MKGVLLKHVEAAVKAARKSTCLHQHGAVIINKKGRVIASGYNKHSKYLHAEVDAVSKIYNFRNRQPFHEYTMIVVRYGPTKLKMSKPCQRCQDFLADIGLSDIYYSDIDGYIEELI